MKPKQQDMFKSETSGMPQAISLPEQPWLVIEIPGRLPSWNEILGMEQWARYKFKDEIQVAFLSALKACASDSSTRTTFARSIMSTAADTLASYRVMRQEQRKLRSAKKRQIQAQQKASQSKSTGSKVAF